MKMPLKFLRVMLLLLGLAVIATACVPFVGNGPDEETPTPEFIPTVIRPTQATSEAPAASPVPTLVPLPTRAQQAATAPPSCTPRTDWPTYTVQSGDTLYSIAQRSDSTQAIVQAANCLADPNKIFEGQTLRVPQELAPSSSTPTAAPAATQPPFFPSPTAANGGVTFTFIAAEGTAAEDSQGSYRAAQDPVRLAISVTNASKIDIVRADGRILDSAQAASGVANVGGTFTLRKIDILEGSSNLIITVRALTPSGATVESAPIRIYWP